MMYGTINPDRLCAVLEQIFAERNDGFTTKVVLIDKETENKNKQEEETA